MKKHQRDQQGRAIKWRDSRFAAKARGRYTAARIFWLIEGSRWSSAHRSEVMSIALAPGDSQAKKTAIAMRKIEEAKYLIEWLKRKPQPLPNL